MRADAAVDRMRLGTAQKLIDSLETVSPGLPETAIVRARLQASYGDFEAAQATYDVLLKRGVERRGIRQNAGEIAFRRKKFRQAYRLFAAEAELYPSALAVHAAGSSLDKLGRSDSSRIAFERALEIDPQYSPAERSLALWYEYEGDFEKALEHIDRALQLEPDNLEYRSTRALLLSRTYRDQEAVAALNAVLVEEPTNYSAEFALARSLRRLGQPDEADRHQSLGEEKRVVMAEIEQLRNSVDGLPTNDRVRVDLANKLRSAGLYDESIEHYSVLLERSGGNLTVAGNLATLYMQKGDTLEAFRRYDRILDIDSTHVETWLNLGFHYARTGRRREALVAWGKAEEYGPDHPGVKAIQRMARQALE
jgi:tetratricopeptide (TPR) repeat protein